uniref:Calpain-like cysteine peptidase,putative,cysteine peptidase, Clan CA, family C2, putative n=1 Tax=Leishmania guyanensis TaxID=5670 RepID=A0A1E1J1Y3_LEIGU|nr:calpain-like cysteine peptidase,putative,cysteine peptidase, Clan CA, family C2, putative [Leishmania guyanensis]
MSYYVGYSQREIYKKRCNELNCACNSAVVQLLSDVPNEVASLIALDLSRNFLGRKGVIPLLDVIEGATQLRSLDLRDQQLGNEAVELICVRLRRHPSLVKLNLSNNPITLAVSRALLELAKQNSVLQYILLEHTFMRPSMVTVIEVQLEQNRARARAASTVSAMHEDKTSRIATTTSSDAGTSVVDVKAGSSRSEQIVLSTPAGGGIAAAVALLHSSAAPMTTGSSELRQRIPAHELQHVLRYYTHAVADVLYDVNPTQDLWGWCEARQYMFDDDQFNSRNNHLHRTARHRYSIAGWRRVGELYPDATLFGWESATRLSNGTAQPSASDFRGSGLQHTCEGLIGGVMDSTRAAVGRDRSSSGAAYSDATSVLWQLPTDVPPGFTWAFTALMASMKEMGSLHTLLCASATGLPDGGMRVQRGTACPGIYTMRIFVEGQWRYLLVDDFLPVDEYGRLIFTKLSMDDKAFWPCILEKMLAKLHGGYHALDSHFDQHHVDIDSSNIHKSIAGLFLSKENLQRATGGGGGGGAAIVCCGGNDADWDAMPGDSLIGEGVAKNCGCVMSRLTRGLYDSYQLHPVEEAPTTKVFEVLHKALGVPLCKADVREGFDIAPSSRRGASVRRSFLGARSVSVDVPASVPGLSPCVTTAMAFSRDVSRTFNGIQPRCGYQIVRVCHTGGVRLLELCNPWCGAEKWTGDWADDSPLWKRHPEVAEILLTRARTGPSAQSDGCCLLQRPSVTSRLINTSLKRSLLATLSETGESLKEMKLSTPPGSVTNPAGHPAPPRTHLQKSTFWIAYTDFLQNFEWVHTCRIFGDEFYRQDVHGAWSRDSAGGNAREPSWYMNPHYRLSFPYRSTVYMQLTRRDPRLRRTRDVGRGHQDCVGGIGLQLLRDTHYPLHCPATSLRDAALGTIAYLPSGSTEDIVAGHRKDDDNTNEVVRGRGVGAPDCGYNSAFASVFSSEVRQIGDCLSLEVMLDAGAEYWIVPTTYAPRVLDEFDLAVISTSPFMLLEAKESEYWDQRTVPPELLCSAPTGTQQVGQTEGEVSIIFDSKTRIASDANLLLQDTQPKRNKRLAHNSVRNSSESASAPLSSALCRVVVAAAVDLTAADEDVTKLCVNEAYERPSLPVEDVMGTPTLQLAIVPGEVDGKGHPTRTVGEIDPHAAHTYALDHHTVLETVLTPVPLNSAEYYTVICALRPAKMPVQVHYRVWCAAPLLEVMSVPMWSKQEMVLCWDDEKGSASYYSGTRHPQVELSKLRPFQRFAVSLRMMDYDTIEPAIMFSVVVNDGLQGEPVEGRLEDRGVWWQSAYVNGTYVQGSFDLDEHPPESLILIACLQPTGSRGKCILTISSDSADYRAYPLRAVGAHLL